MFEQVWDVKFGKLVEELNRGLYYRFEACGWKPRRVERLRTLRSWMESFM